MNKTIDLFDIKTAYSDGKPLSNDSLYKKLSTICNISHDEFNTQTNIGNTSETTSKLKRKVRWYQQTLKKIGVIERIPEKRSIWKMTRTAKGELTEAVGPKVMLGYSTKLGVALWSRAQDTFYNIDTPITLALTSPPYPLKNPKKYGNPDISEYIDFVTELIEPIVKNLRDGGTIALNISPDIFVAKMPARSLYKERLILALADAFNLYKIDEVIWHNPTKVPGPTYWACRERFMLRYGYEVIVLFSNNPEKLVADNRRVLIEHSESHLKYMHGEKRYTGKSSDGAHSKNKKGYQPTRGKIPTNVLSMAHRCSDQLMYKKHAKECGLLPHSATFPLRLAIFFIKYLTEKDDLVVDFCAGSQTTAVAANMLKRRFITTDIMAEYIAGGATRYKNDDSLYINPALVSCCATLPIS